MKKISVVLPVYNGSKTIEKAVKSVLSQTYENLELIIVNDCSTDNTLDIISGLANNDSRIKIHNNENNKKLPMSLNIGFGLATGDYFTWTSDDNMYKENALEVLASYLDKYSEVDFVYSDFNMVNLDGTLRSVEKKEKPDYLKFFNCVGACFLYRKTLADKIGGYDPDLFLAEDYEYWIKAYLNGKMLHIPKNLYDYGWHDKSLTVSRRDEIAHKTFEAKDKHLEELYLKCTNDGDRIRFFYDMLGMLNDEKEIKDNTEKYYKMCKAFRDADKERELTKKKETEKKERDRKKNVVEEINERTTFDFSLLPGKEQIRECYHGHIECTRISIITPYYNASEYFEQTFNSVINQTFPWFEWIIVNDGSTEIEDIELLEGLEERDSRIKVCNQANAGPETARNKGVGLAKSELLVFLDADDLLMPQYLECLYWALYYNPDASWAYADTVGFGSMQYFWKRSFNAKIMKKENVLTITSMVRKKDYLEAGGFKKEDFQYNEDWRLWLDMLSMGKYPVHVSSYLSWYRRADSGRLASLNKDKKKIKFDKKIIREAGNGVNESLSAIEYPFVETRTFLYKAKFEKYNEKSRSKKADSEKRILWLFPHMVLGGADKFNLDAISGLKNKGFGNYVLTTLGADNSWKQKFESICDEVFTMADFLDPAHYLEFISYFIQTREIDYLVVSNSYAGYYMLPWIRTHFPNLIIADYIHTYDPIWRNGGFCRNSEVFRNIIDKTYVCNSSVKKAMVEKFDCDPEDIDIVYIGVDEKDFSKEAVSDYYLHDELKIDRSRPIILFPCRIDWPKRSLMTVDIMKKVVKKVPDVAFIIVGDGPKLPELRDKIAKENMGNNMFCFGATNKMKECYKDSDLVLICSSLEGLTLTSYEACSMGIPVISSDVGGQKDLIDEKVGRVIHFSGEGNHKAEYFFDDNEIEEYANAISELLLDEQLRQELGRNARKRIEEGFTIDNMVDSLANELINTLPNEKYSQRRAEMSEFLHKMPDLGNDIYSLYLEWDRPGQGMLGLKASIRAVLGAGKRFVKYKIHGEKALV